MWMRKNRSPSKATRLTLNALVDSPAGMHGYEIMKSAGVKPGTLYPMLARLEDQGFLVSEWEASTVSGRPPRHKYSLTASGRKFAASMVDDRQPVSTRKLKPKTA